MESLLTHTFDRVRKSINSSYLQKWVTIGILIGLVAGLGSAAFYYILQFTTNGFLGAITGFYPPNPIGELSTPLTVNPNYYLLPLSLALGGLGSGLLIYYLAPEAEGHGTDAAIDAFHKKNGIIRKRVPLVKMLASALTIGSGGSAGREGPTAQISAGFGSFLGGVFGLSAKDRRIAVAAGIGAGIGSIFKSPFGGAILSAEILYSAGDMEVEALIPSFIASPVGYVIFASFTNFNPIFGNSVNYTFTHPINLLFYAILGALTGIVGKFYSEFFYRIRDLFSKLKIKRYFRPMIGGAIAGIIAIFFPEVTGMGYGYLQYLIDGKIELIKINYLVLPLLGVFVALIFAKIIATSFTIGSGGSGGVFAPSLVIGGFVGAALWRSLYIVNPSIIPSPAPFVIVGMMALFAGVGRVPIAVILMVSEMTGTLALMVPSMVAVVISYFIVGPKYSIYKSQVMHRADSPAHRGDYNIPVLASAQAKDVMVADPATIDPSESVLEAETFMLKNAIKRAPVTIEGKLVGMLSQSDLRTVKSENKSIVSVSQIMTRNVIYCHPTDSLLDVFKKMTINEIKAVPVVSNEEGKVVGVVYIGDIHKAYRDYESGSA